MKIKLTFILLIGISLTFLFTGCIDDLLDSTCEEACENIWDQDCYIDDVDMYYQDAADAYGFSKSETNDACEKSCEDEASQEEINCNADADSCAELRDC